MPVFEYKAMDGKGGEKKGVHQADTARQLRAWLRDQQLIPLTVNEVNKNTGQSGSGSALFSFRGIKHDEIVLLTRQLATLLSAGMPVEEALLGVSEQSEHPRVKKMMSAVRSKVMEGHTLAFALADYPGVFSELYRALVEAGESSGHLDTVLSSLADYTESQQTIRQKIIQAAIYPILMMIVSCAIVVFLLWFVVPQLISVFEDNHQTLPILTQMLLFVSDNLQAYGLYLLVGVFIVMVLVRTTLARTRIYWHRIFLVIPVIGRMVRVINTARYARTLGILSSAGVPVLEAMHSACQVVTIIPIREKMNQAIVKVREGVSIHRALKQTGYFPPMSVHLIASGEASGQLEAMLEKAADSQDKAVQTLINSAVSLFEPLMTVVMGGVVLLIVLAVLLPIFNLTQVVT